MNWLATPAEYEKNELLIVSSKAWYNPKSQKKRKKEAFIKHKKENIIQGTNSKEPI
jgi:hypothetical protein